MPTAAILRAEQVRFRLLGELEPNQLGAGRANQGVRETGDTIRYLEYEALGQVKVVTDSAFTDPTCHYEPETGWYFWGPSTQEEVDPQSF